MFLGVSCAFQFHSSKKKFSFWADVSSKDFPFSLSEDPSFFVLFPPSFSLIIIAFCWPLHSVLFIRITIDAGIVAVVIVVVFV